MKRITVALLSAITVGSLGANVHQHMKLTETRAEAAMYEEMLRPIVMCLANNGVVAHDGTSLRCVIRGRATHLQ